MTLDARSRSATSAARRLDVKVEHVACAACGADAPRPYRSGMYRIGDTKFDLVRCPCGLVYVEPRPDDATLVALYDDPDYYTHGYNLGVETENYFARKDELVAQYAETLAQYERETGHERETAHGRETSQAKGDLFELGSAGGFFLIAGQQRGWRVKGVELSPPAAEYSIREMKLDVFLGRLEDAPYPEPSFDLALADNVLEHTTRPGRTLEKLFRLLRPGGHLVIIVPAYVNSPWFRGILRVKSLLPRRFLGKSMLALLKFDGEDAGLPYHILEFDRPTLERLVRGAGFEIEKIERSVPLPAHLFKAQHPDFKTRLLRAAFRTVDALMRAGLLPGARLRIVARRP